MSKIEVTPELLRGKAGEVRKLRETHDEAMKQLQNLVRALNEIWKGEAQSAFVAKFDSMKTQFTQFSEMLENHAKNMETAADKLQETDQSLKNSLV